MDVAVVAEGVTHVWSLTAQWFEDMTSDVQDLVDGVRASRDNEWETADGRPRRGTGTARRLPTRLLTCSSPDEKWLALSNEKTRREHATQLARAAIGREGCQEQRVRGRITGAVLSATQRRAEEIIPERQRRAISQLPQIAADLAAMPEFAAARTKSERERVGRALLLRVAPLVPPAELLTSLLTQADAG